MNPSRLTDRLPASFARIGEAEREVPVTLMEQEIPLLLVKRDLKHARRACHDHEWAYAIQLCDNLLAGIAPDHPDCLALRRSILRRRRVRRTLLVLAGVAATGPAAGTGETPVPLSGTAAATAPSSAPGAGSARRAPLGSWRPQRPHESVRAGRTRR